MYCLNCLNLALCKMTVSTKLHGAKDNGMRDTMLHEPTRRVNNAPEYRGIDDRMNSYAVLHSSDKSLFGSVIDMRQHHQSTPIAIRKPEAAYVSHPLSDNFDVHMIANEEDVDCLLTQIRDALNTEEPTHDEEDYCGITGVLRMVETALADDDDENSEPFSPNMPDHPIVASNNNAFQTPIHARPMTTLATVATSHTTGIYNYRDSTFNATEQSNLRPTYTVNAVDTNASLLGPQFLAFTTGTQMDTSSFSVTTDQTSVAPPQMYDDDCGETDTVLRIAEKYLPANMRRSQVSSADLESPSIRYEEHYSMATIEYLRRHQLNE